MITGIFGFQKIKIYLILLLVAKYMKSEVIAVIIVV